MAESKYTFSFIYPLWLILSSKRKRQIIICLQLITLNGILDLISVTSILPLLYLLTSKPEAIFNHSFVSLIANFFDIKDPNQFLIYSTILFAFVAVISGTLRLSNLFYTSKISGLIASDISIKIFSKVIYQPYSYHVTLNSSEVITTITNYINNLNSGLISVLQFITSIILSLFIVIGILLVNWKLSLFGFFVFSILYVFIAVFAKKRLNRNSEVVANANQSLVKGVQESLGSIRDIIIDNLYGFYIDSHKKKENSMRILIAQNMFLTFFPRYALESITLVLISFIIIFKANIFENSDPIVPTIGALSIGIQKLLPSFQSLYVSWASINSHKSSINKLLKFIKLQEQSPLIEEKPLNFKRKRITKKIDFLNIRLLNLFFQYDLKENYILNNLNLEIKRGEKIGIIGKTGDGKSTLLDIIMGLTKPTSGEILINGKNINSDKKYMNLWRKNISHVPQNIYMSDRTIAENIALGYSKNNINIDRLNEASKEAEIYDFINSLENKYNSAIGEGGLKISGGQRQRIGIARALYNNPDILILDEATSSLDEDTEEEIMKSLVTRRKDNTIIIVTHRPKTLRYCDRIIKLEKGSIVSDQNLNK